MQRKAAMDIHFKIHRILQYGLQFTHMHTHTHKYPVKMYKPPQFVMKKTVCKKGYFVPYAYISEYTHGTIYKYFC